MGEKLNGKAWPESRLCLLLSTAAYTRGSWLCSGQNPRQRHFLKCNLFKPGIGTVRFDVHAKAEP